MTKYGLTLSSELNPPGRLVDIASMRQAEVIVKQSEMIATR